MNLQAVKKKKNASVDLNMQGEAILDVICLKINNAVVRTQAKWMKRGCLQWSGDFGKVQ